MIPQLPLALRFPPDLRFDGFVGSPGAVAEVSVAAARPSRCLFLAGPAGSGKTHLMLAACAEAERLGRRSVYLPLAALSGRLDQALQGHESLALACLDGVDIIAGRPDDEVALFHFHNRASDAGLSVVYAARQIPPALGLGLPDLLSRLGQCTRVRLETLADPGRKDVLLRRAARRGLELEPAVVDYLFTRVGRDLGSLTAWLDRMDQASLAAQRRITVPFVSRLLADSASQNGP